MNAKPLLSRESMPEPAKRALPERVLQFGEGVFLRGYFDWMLQQMNRQGLFNGSALVIKPRPHGSGITDLNAQGGTFTLWTRGEAGGKAIDSLELIGSISRGLNPAQDWERYLAAAAQPELRFVVSNTTEAGLSYAAEKRPEFACPAGFPAKLTAFLYRRFQHFEGGASKGMIVIPLELLENNGQRLKSAVMQHAADWKLEPVFSAWVEKHCRFINSLVDRIVPGKPADLPSLDYRDELLVCCEPYHLLVLEAEQDLGGELPLAKAGLNVRFVKDLAPYRELKLRILNGAHSYMASLGFLMGCDSVSDCLQRQDFRVLLERLLGEAAEVLALPKDEIRSYTASVLERFQNPYLRHPLANIAMNCSSKFKARLLPTLLDGQRLKKRLPKACVSALAALFVYQRGQRASGSYAIQDEPAALAYFGRFWALGNGLEKRCPEFLADAGFWGQNLAKLPGLADALALEIGELLRLAPALSAR